VTAPYPALSTTSSLARLDPASGRHLWRTPGAETGRSRATDVVNGDGPPSAQAPRMRGGGERPSTAILVHHMGCAGVGGLQRWPGVEAGEKGGSS
jgi:hypothetical protein